MCVIPILGRVFYAPCPRAGTSVADRPTPVIATLRSIAVIGGCFTATSHTVSVVFGSAAASFWPKAEGEMIALMVAGFGLWEVRRIGGAISQCTGPGLALPGAADDRER